MLSSLELRSRLEKLYPLNATCWSQATDEVRDMCREARNILDLDERHAVDFRRLKTPSEWNTVGIDGIVKFYDQMDGKKRSDFLAFSESKL